MGNTPDGMTEAEQRIWADFYDMQVLFWRRMAQRLQRDTGLSEPDLAILRALLDAPERRLRGYELAGVTQFEKSRLHHHIGRMEARGLVVRESTPTQPRAAVVALSEAGEKAITEALPKREEHIRHWLLDSLEPAQVEALGGISRTVLERLRDEEADEDEPAGGGC
ncbi:MarR family winged helix-turn-helix transcriptional regulator [Phytomonospora sp. NPDC050363]|uniref:MarR family winged helix-turn-helix transcriptional regulator n=1 Tax=Phytomonospora sp. NPDC050363 TaxID=3155642 RepID=UPI0033E899B2